MAGTGVGPHAQGVCAALLVHPAPEPMGPWVGLQPCPIHSVRRTKLSSCSSNPSSVTEKLTVVHWPATCGWQGA